MKLERKYRRDRAHFGLGGWFRATGLAVSLLAVALPAPAAERQGGTNVGAPRPNILVILCDDLGYADVGFNGSPDIRTPSIDRLARDGMVFTSAYVVHPFCGPSRMGFITGRYPHEFGGPFNLPITGQWGGGEESKGLPVAETTIATVLQRAGYHTGAIGKWHMGIRAPFHPNNRGFDEFFGFLGGGHLYFPEEYKREYAKRKAAGVEEIDEYLVPLEHNGRPVDETEYLTDAFSREAVRFDTDAAGRDAPFFLYLAYNAPHAPLQATDADLALYAHIPDEKRRIYAAMVHAVDRGVGRIVDALEETGQLENTLIVFFSDNGGKLTLGANNGPLRDGKGSTHEGGWRVPMFFHWPREIPAGARCDDPVSALDFYPTFAALAGAAIPEGKDLDGVNLWPVVAQGRSPAPARPLFVLRHRKGYHDAGVRQGRWKAVRVGRGPWRLYDMRLESGETLDLSDMYPDVLDSLVKAEGAWAENLPQPLWFHTLEEGEQWRADAMPHYAETFAHGKDQR
ncbi:MAG: sulfatase [Verrucomicrobia bacterium]|nr:MAG: sulfatase [Verrucomicrobiota bacterium]